MGKENPGNAVNLLCEGTVIVGDIKTKNDIRIDGIIKGKIITSGRLVVGNTAKIEGNIDCCNVDVLGVVLVFSSFRMISNHRFFLQSF